MAADLLVVTRFTVPEADVPPFTERAGEVLAALRVRPGYLAGRLGRATDDPTAWVLTTEWETVGAYRRALGSYEFKLAAPVLFGWARDEPSAFEVLRSDEAGEGVLQTSDRTSDRGEPTPGGR